MSRKRHIGFAFYVVISFALILSFLPLGVLTSGVRAQTIGGVQITSDTTWTNGFAASDASAPEVQWSKTIMSLAYPIASVQQTSDGGYITVGTQWDEPGNMDTADVWLVKTDSAGDHSWDSTFGGSSGDAGRSVQQTSDGGYVIAGSTESYGAGGCDVWLIKTDSAGNHSWDTTFGGSADDSGYSVQQTSDGGYIIAGSTESYGAGGYDVWLVKTDSAGNHSWDKTFGGSADDGGLSNWGMWAISVQQTSDGGYIVAADTQSYGAGATDVWLIKTDLAGNHSWDKTFGGSEDDLVYSVRQTSDGGYVMTGATYSYGAGRDDVWLIKTDSAGNHSWDKTFGGSEEDAGLSVQQTLDGGYIIGGGTNSYGAGICDVWVIKTDSAGSHLWDSTFGGTLFDWSSSIQQTSDGGYIAANATEASFESYSNDVWLMKFAADTAGNQPPSQPSGVSPTGGATGVSLAPTLQASDFSDPDSGDTHAASQWQITTTAGNYSSLVVDSGTDAAHLTSTTTSTLSYSTTYYWHVRYEDNNGAWSNWSTETSFSTTSAPTIDTTPPTTPAVTDDGATTSSTSQLHASWTSSDTESGVAEYQYAIGTTSGGTDVVAWTSVATNTEVTKTGLGLSAGTKYFICIKAMNGVGLWSDIGISNGITVAAEGMAVEDIPTAGGTVQTADGKITADFPANTAVDVLTVTIENMEPPSDTSTPQGFKAGNTYFVMEITDASGNPVVTLSQPITITVKYSDEDVTTAGGDPNNLVLAYYDEATSEWNSLATTVNTTDKILSATTTHISTWGVLATAAEGNGMPFWVWIIVGVAAVLVVGPGAFLVSKRRPAKP